MYGRIIYKLTAVFTAAMIQGMLHSQPALQYKSVITSLDQPVDVVNAGDGSNRLFIVQKGGIIKVYDQAFRYAGDFLNLPGVSVQGERGLLSLAFHPAYKTNGLFFIYYTNAQGNIEISRYKVSTDPNAADTSSKTVMLTIPHPGATNHNGGKLLFSADGYLYFATGDGGGSGDARNNAQNGQSLLGKMIRIDINKQNPPLPYSIPPDNPYINDTATADEIWAMGLRNPWRWSFDRLTHDMWIADVGQNQWEEVNFRKAGETRAVNYGWRCYEGTHSFNATGCQLPGNYTSPIFEYNRSAGGGYAVTGGYVYRGQEFPSLNGHYIFADYLSGSQWTITDSSNTWIIKRQTGTFPRHISSFGESEDGTLYACALSAGILYKIEAVTPVMFRLLTFNGVARSNTAELQWSAEEQDLVQYEIEGSTDSIHFVQKGMLPAKNQASGNNYRFTDNIAGIKKIYYRLRITGQKGKWDYSKTITVFNSPAGQFVYPTFITNRKINSFIPGAYDQFQVFNVGGALVINKDIRGITGRLEVPVAHLASGIYLVRITNRREQLLQRIFIQ